MNKGLEYYQRFIDGLVAKKDGVETSWILNGRYLTDDDHLNTFLTTLTPDQRKLIARMLREARMGGIHDTLAYMNEMMDLDGLVLSQNGIPLPHDEYAGLHFDFFARCSGEEWPE